MLEIYKKACEPEWARGFEHCIALKFDNFVPAYPSSNLFFIALILSVIIVVIRLKNS